MRRLWQSSASEKHAIDNEKTCPKLSRGERLKATAAARGTGAKADIRGMEPRARFWPPTWRDPVKHWTTLAAAGFLAAAAFVPAQAADISGAGATFPYPIYAKWADAYKKETGNGLNYQSIGSGGGIKQITARTVTFGASDMPLQPEELEKIGVIQFPTVMGGIVPVVNLDGIKSGDLTIDGPTLAKIYLGEIKTWDDAAHQEAEPEREAALTGDRGRAPLGRLRHHLHLHQLSVEGERGLEVARSAATRRSNGRPASAPRATKALPTTSATPKARSVMSRRPTPSRTS